jgi:riboflavin synthase
MFTGIIEKMGIVHDVIGQGSNKTLWVTSELASELKVDQSVAHNGVCLTVVEIQDGRYAVTAIDETLKKSNLGSLKKGSLVNLERCMLSNGRFDGHMVYGHVDGVGVCTSLENSDGSYVFTFEFNSEFGKLLVEKGSVTINGISLTIFDVKSTTFKVAIIPYTYEHTNIQTVRDGVSVNLEFDILGKYVAKLTNK